MRNILKLLFQRVVLVSLSILLQIVLMIFFMTRLADYRPWFEALMAVLRVVSVLYLVAAPQTTAAYKTAWIMLILAFPVAGVSIFLLLGGNRLSRREKRRMYRISLMTEKHLQQEPAVLRRLQGAEPDASFPCRYLLNAARCPVWEDTQAEYFSSGEACWKRMLETLREAKKYIFLEYFIIQDGEMWTSILDILADKVSEGVEVRLIYDDFGCIRRLPYGYSKRMEEIGIHARVFNPFVPVASGRLNNRDHRKLLIVDGEIGFTGGINLSDEYICRTHPFGDWKDAGLCLRGPAVWSMTVMFLSMWDTLTGQEEDCAALRPQTMLTSGRGFVQPFSDSPLDNEAVCETVYLHLITRARKNVWFMTPYLVLDERMSSALCMAAKSGVDVRIITPGRPDKWYVYSVTRANYEALITAGVRIFEYTPGFVHSKVCCVDGRLAVVGTINLDFRSLYLHYEDGVLLADADCLAAVTADFEQTFPRCREVSEQTVRATPFWKRLYRSMLQLLAPLM